MNANDKITIIELMQQSLDNTISEEGFSKLNAMLKSSDEASQYYREIMCIYTRLREHRNIIASAKDTIEDILDESTWASLAEHEKTAPEIKISKKEPQHGLIQKVVYPPRNKRKVSKVAVFALANTAALILIFLYLKFIPPNAGIEVATLTDSINAKWADMAEPIEKGTRITTGCKRLLLMQGYAELLFDTNARLVIEAPAEFQILAEDRIGLNYGKVYAWVSQEALGFSVFTHNAKIFDLGTEFGVEADFRGNTLLHVIKGKTMLIAGHQSNNKSIEVSSGQAKKVSALCSGLSDISCDSDLFVRNIDSQFGFVWKGQNNIDLADIVRNGNGLGTGNSSIRLDPIKGFTHEQHFFSSVVENKFMVIKDHPFIDGVFIPDGETVISSRDDVFENYPITGGIYINDLLASPTPGIFGGHRIHFYGQEYSDRGKSCIVMHGNHGITFDLEAIRQAYHCSIDRFASRFGIADLQQKACNANMYVLVDGQVRYSLLQYKQKGVLNDVLINIEDTDRFLTLTTTEAIGDNGTFIDNWSVFTEPVLVME